MDAKLKQIKRLQDQNKILAECLADERRLRKLAYGWYQRRLLSKWGAVLDLIMISLKRL